MEKIRDANNYFLLRSKARTGLLLFERRKTQLTLVFEKYPTQTKFENDEAPLANRQKKFIISGVQFEGLMAQEDVEQVLNETDSKINQLANLSSLNTQFDYYSINAISKIINVQPEPQEGIYTPLISYSPTEFDAIMQDTQYAPHVVNTVEMAWKIGAMMDEELAVLISEEE